MGRPQLFNWSNLVLKLPQASGVKSVGLDVFGLEVDFEYAFEVIAIVGDEVFCWRIDLALKNFDWFLVAFIHPFGVVVFMVGFVAVVPIRMISTLLSFPPSVIVPIIVSSAIVVAASIARCRKWYSL